MRFPKYGIWIMKKIVLGAMLVASTASFAANGDAYTWPTYRSDLDYDTKSNLGEIAPPTEFNNNCSGVTGKKLVNGGQSTGARIVIPESPT